MIKEEDKLKSLSAIGRELGFKVIKTFHNHIQRDEVLRAEIKSGVQCLRAQKLLYEKFGYPPEVSKADYENV